MKKRKLLTLTLLTVVSLIGLASCGGTPFTTIEQQTTSQTNAQDSSSNASSASVKISGTSTCEVGNSVTLIADVTNDNTREGVEWSSSSTAIASVNQNGKVTGVAEGTCQITASLVADSTIKDTITFTVTASSEPSVEINVSSKIVTINTELTLQADVYNPKGKELTYEWSISNGKGTLVNAASANATFTGNKVGDEKVTLKVYVGQTPLETSINLYISDDYTNGYTAISTADEFKEKVLNNQATGTVSNKFYLANDIDLGGLKFNGNNIQITFSGVLDGRGHTLSNYEIIGNKATSNYYENTALFKTVSGTIRNLHVSVKTNQEGVGWGSSILANELSGEVSNCLIEYENAYNQGIDGWFPFNGAICGILKETGKVINDVVNVTGEGQGGVMAIAAYPAGGVTETGETKAEQVFTVNGVYTNQTSAATFGSSWEWGGPITIAKNVVSNLVFSSANASTYTTLNDNVWDLQDNVMPTLKTL